MNSWILACSALALGSLAILPADEKTTNLADLGDATLRRLDGEYVQLSELNDGSPLVLTYTGVACPISGKYAPRLARLEDAFAQRGVQFVAVNASPHDTREAIAAEEAELGLGYLILKDFRQELTRRLEAKTTTEVFVFDARGTLQYRGAVDDQYALGAAKPEPTKNFLVDALEAILEGGAPANEATRAPGCKLTLLPEGELPEAVTWANDIAPILRNNCESCHRPGQVGPFALQTFEQARGWGEMIASVVEEQRMPPWNADERFNGHFVNERRLRAKDRELIQQWVAGGMPRGPEGAEPEPATWPDGWRIGEPDAVFAMERVFDRELSLLPEEGFAVPREGTVDYKHFAVKTDFAEDRWIQSMELLPGAADVVHHIVVGLWDPAESPRFTEQALLNYLAVAVPGDTPSIFPDGYAKILPAGSWLVFQMHYTPNGKERFDRSSLGLIFAEEPPVFEVMSTAVLDTSLSIPAGDDNFEWSNSLTLNEEVGIISFFPHMHTRGKDFQYIAHYPDGESEELLFSHYDFNWQESYIYEDPKFLPAGTRLECIAHYDNSANNPNNPDPDSVVRWGDQTWEEMFVGYFDHVVPLEY